VIRRHANVLGAVALAWVAGLVFAHSALVDAQPPAKLPRVVVLMPGSPQGTLAESVRALRDGLESIGYVHGQTMMLEEWWNERGPEHWHRVVTDALHTPVDVLVSGSAAATRAATQATSTVALVSPTLPSPIEDGYAASLARPGGNVTGLTMLTPELTAKRVELIKAAVPGLARIALVLQQVTAVEQRILRDSEGAARALGLQIAVTREVRDGADIDTAFAEAAGARVGAVILGQGALFAGERARIGRLAVRHRLPTIAGETGSARAGGLLEYAADIPANFRRAATYIDRILKGAKPGDLPIEQPTKIALVINLETAKALGLTIPQSLLLRADEIIQ
jgi:ABC-type uncharacterized transport system substrate-binding protein